MASEQHNFILSAIARKVRSNGFEIIYLDGKPNDIGTKKFYIPPKITNHKPDIIGGKIDGSFCIGEAKTKNDLYSERTKKQIVDFLEIVKQDSRNVLILGIPMNSKDDLKQMLEKLAVSNREQIQFVYVPELLLPYEENI